MSNAVQVPKTLLEIIRFFADEQRAFECVRDRRWPDGRVICPCCGSFKVKFMATQRRWNCNDCRKQFSAKTGTIFEESPIPFSKWLPAMWLITNAKNGISSYEVHRALGVTQKTAWFMLHRIRLAMQQGSFEMMGGKDGAPVEVDETFIGGKARNMHDDRRKRIFGGKQGMSSPATGKEVVLGFLERGGKVRTFHVESQKGKHLTPPIRENVKEDSWLYTDGSNSYVMMGDFYRHEFVDHAVSYVEGHVHTNTLENYWSLLKRSIKGTYVSVEPFHLFRYLDEQAFRYNERKDDDRGRFLKVLDSVVGKRVMYRELTGKMECPPAI